MACVNERVSETEGRRFPSDCWKRPSQMECIRKVFNLFHQTPSCFHDMFESNE